MRNDLMGFTYSSIRTHVWPHELKCTYLFVQMSIIRIYYQKKKQSYLLVAKIAEKTTEKKAGNKMHVSFCLCIRMRVIESS